MLVHQLNMLSNIFGIKRRENVKHISPNYKKKLFAIVQNDWPRLGKILKSTTYNYCYIVCFIVTFFHHYHCFGLTCDFSLVFCYVTVVCVLYSCVNRREQGIAAPLSDMYFLFLCLCFYFCLYFSSSCLHGG